MTASLSSDLTARSAEGVATPAVQVAGTENGAVARIDFAWVVGKQFLVYGWVLGLTKSAVGASIYFGGVVIDLAKQAIPVRRPDVALHFSMETGNDEHGFYALIDLPEKVALVDHLRLSVTLSSGKTTESRWPVSCLDSLAASVLEPCAATLKGLLPHLPRHEAKRLIEFATPALHLGVPTLPPPIRFDIDMCCVLENRILVASGWFFDPVKELTLAQVRVGGSVFDLLENSVPIARPDINLDASPYRMRETTRPPGFIFVQAIPPQDTEADAARFTVAAGAQKVNLTRPVSLIPEEARRDFLASLSKMEPDSALVLIERMTAVLDNSPNQRSLRALLELVRDSAVERLPPSIQHVNPRYFLHLDQAIPVADKGVFLVGWFNAEPNASVQVVCHCSSSSFALSDHWVRQFRTDVTSHLTKAGIPVGDHDHGYSCYVPLRHGDAPYYLSAVSGSGEVRRMRVTLSEKLESALQTVRALLGSFALGHRRGASPDGATSDLWSLMEHHIGPAVGTAWAARVKSSRTSTVHTYGAKPANPSVSIIVPLFGRHDFAEFQMALFANDPEFQTVELIYVVDDPTIVNEFLGVCADLYGIYQVPFVAAYPGSNLGFGGANNFGAELARGQYLLLMNSDVFPRRPGWLGDLLRIYRSLPAPGLLGAKLLYEDGSIQHAGMAFRRLAEWGDLWINHHPLKGQSPLGLSGVKEAEAVTAACALIETTLFRELGGFSEDYIIGDFEDSDLCLRANLAGRRNYVALDIELYHLERQSQNRVGGAVWRTNLTFYNGWLHHRRWADQIEKMNAGKA
jgi:GT2 family glycosyltransferase